MVWESFPLISIIPLIRVTESDLAMSYSFPCYRIQGAVSGPLSITAVWLIMGSVGHLQWWHLCNYCSYSSIYLMVSHAVLLADTLIVAQWIVVIYSDPSYGVTAWLFGRWPNHGLVQWFAVSFNVWSDTLPSFWASCIDVEDHLAVETSWEDKYHY